eukprot:COSAG01_NODE_6966_length_3413_cov_7.056427_4_plen_129_part_00
MRWSLETHAAHTTVNYCNAIEAAWLVNGGHGASLRHHTASQVPDPACALTHILMLDVAEGTVSAVPAACNRHPVASDGSCGHQPAPPNSSLRCTAFCLETERKPPFKTPETNQKETVCGTHRSHCSCR